MAQDNDPAAGVNQDFSVCVATMVYGVCIDDLYEENDSFATAATPFGGTLFNLQICESDEDYFRFNATAGSNISITINFTHGDGNLSLYLYDPSQSLLGSSTSSTDDEQVLASGVATTGWYYARVVGVGAAENSYDFTSAVAGAEQTISTTIACIPESGTLPYTLQVWPQLCNDSNSTRTLAGHLDLTIGNGSFYPNWRAGFTNVIGNNCYFTVIGLNMPALGSLAGDNTFTLVGEDVTAAPYNQPPYSPSGDTASASCVSTAN